MTLFTGTVLHQPLTFSTFGNPPPLRPTLDTPLSIQKTECNTETQARGFQQERRNNTLDNTTGTNNGRQAQERGRSRINQMKKGEVPPNVNIAQLSHLICFYTNADNLLNKRSEFEVALGLHKPDMVCIIHRNCTKALFNQSTTIIITSGRLLCSNVGPTYKQERCRKYTQQDT